MGHQNLTIMKKSVFSLLLAAAILSMPSCKKTDDTPQPINIPGQGTLPAGTAGAFYAVFAQAIDPSLPDSIDLSTTTAWFESYTKTANAGTVTSNGVALTIKD